MAQRRHHYEKAFEAYLRLKRAPYVAVDEARKALLPPRAVLRLESPADEHAGGALKSFDFVVYAPALNLLVDVKGRKPGRSGRRLESWVTEDDVESLTAWRALFGRGFDAAFVFMHWLDVQPPDGAHREVFEHHARWYALSAIRLDDYTRRMAVRSRRWRTVQLPAGAFERASRPFAALWAAGGPHGTGPPRARNTGSRGASYTAPA